MVNLQRLICNLSSVGIAWWFGSRGDLPPLFTAVYAVWGTFEHAGISFLCGFFLRRNASLHQGLLGPDRRRNKLRQMSYFARFRCTRWLHDNEDKTKSLTNRFFKCIISNYKLPRFVHSICTQLWVLSQHFADGFHIAIRRGLCLKKAFRKTRDHIRSRCGTNLTAVRTMTAKRIVSWIFILEFSTCTMIQSMWVSLLPKLELASL